METVTGVITLAVTYVLGTGHGLLLAWTQEARCRRWARLVGAKAETALEWYDREPAS